MHGQIFISYRRDDSSHPAGRLYDRLCTHFASDQIFMDVDTLPPGVDFVEAIERSVSSCDVLIALIGKNWLTSSDEEGQRRIDNAEDFVRIEIATALKRNICVIPVLVDDASMPKSREVPDELKTLVRRHALEVRHSRFKDDCGRLIVAVERVLKTARAQAPNRSRGRTSCGDRRDHQPAPSRSPSRFFCSCRPGAGSRRHASGSKAGTV
jgi:hypothetical protein